MMESAARNMPVNEIKGEGAKPEPVVAIDDLKDYLNRYKRCRMRDEQLKARHAEIQRELKDPGMGSTYHTMPRAKSSDSNGAYGVIFRLAEIETRIDEQRNEMSKALLVVMDVLDYLPQDSYERAIVEMRHIDLRRWDEIPALVQFSRQRCFDYYNKALNTLLTCPRVCQLVLAYTEEKYVSEYKIGLNCTF